MNEDKKFYAAWGIFFILVGVGIITWLMNYPFLSPLLILCGMGIVLISLSDLKGYLFFTGVSLISIGALIFGIMYGLGLAISFAIFIIILGILLLYYMLRR